MENFGHTRPCGKLPRLALVCCLLGALGCGTPPGSGDTATLPIPHPSLENIEELPRRQLREGRERFEAVSHSANVDATALSEAFGELGMLYHAYALREAAIACYLNAQRLAPEDFRWPYLLGRIYPAAGEAERAVASFERAMELRPDHLVTWIRLATLYQDQGRPEAARLLLEQALELAPDTAAAHLGLGNLALSERDFDDAVRHLKAALELQPGATKMHYPLAMAYRGQGEVELARIHLEQHGRIGVSLPDPLMSQLSRLTTGARLHLKRAATAARAGQFAAAAAEYARAVEADPDNVDARMNLAVMHARLGDRARATEQFEAALLLSPDNPEIHHNLAVLLTQLGQDVEAIEHFDSTLAVLPEHWKAHFYLADALMRGERYAEALEHYQAVIAIDPRSAQARLRCSMTLIRLQRYGEARRLLEESQRLLPTDSGLLHALARLLSAAPDDEVRDGTTGLELARRVRASTDALAPVETLAMALAEKGRFGEAADLQRKAIAAVGDGDSRKLRALRRNLERYESGVACREPWSMDDAVFAPRPPR